jgi:hypothetical protein
LIRKVWSFDTQTLVAFFLLTGLFVDPHLKHQIHHAVCSSDSAMALCLHLVNFEFFYFSLMKLASYEKNCFSTLYSFFLHFYAREPKTPFYCQGLFSLIHREFVPNLLPRFFTLDFIILCLVKIACFASEGMASLI